MDAGPYTVTSGLYNGREHVFVTHRETGHQWVSKVPYTGSQSAALASQIACGIIQFRPGHIIGSCDGRFWMPVTKPFPRNEFDALCFIGD